jgi:hypothetical protein
MQVMFSFSQEFYDYWNSPYNHMQNSAWRIISSTTTTFDIFSGYTANSDRVIHITDDRILDATQHNCTVVYSEHFMIMTPRDIVKMRLSNASSI